MMRGLSPCCCAGGGQRNCAALTIYYPRRRKLLSVARSIQAVHPGHPCRLTATAVALSDQADIKATGQPHGLPPLPLTVGFATAANPGQTCQSAPAGRRSHRTLQRLNDHACRGQHHNETGRSEKASLRFFAGEEVAYSERRQNENCANTEQDKYG